MNSRKNERIYDQRLFALMKKSEGKKSKWNSYYNQRCVPTIYLHIIAIVCLRCLQFQAVTEVGGGKFEQMRSESHVRSFMKFA